MNPMDMVKIPFRIADNITRPIMDKVEAYMGKDVDTFIEALPGGKMLQNATGSFNRWLEAPGESKKPDKIVQDEEDQND